MPAQAFDDYPRPWRAWTALALLGALCLVSFIDRGVLALLVHPIRVDLGLSDLQMGLLFGSAFALSFSVLGLLFGRLADSWNRRRLILLGVMVWSLCTIGNGFTTAYVVLVVLRVGLAVGEATLTPSAHSMVGDLFPPQLRPIAASIYQTMGFAGQGLGAVLAGFLINALDHAVANGALKTHFAVWQLVFIAVGVPPLLLAAVFALFCKEPARRLSQSEPGTTLRELFAYLRENARLFGGLFLGASLMLTINGAMLAWGPEFVRRTYGWNVRDTGTALGLLTLLAVLGSTLLGPIVTRMLQRRGRPDAVVLVGFVSATLGSICAVCAFLQPNASLFIVFEFLSVFLINGGGNNILFAMQDLAPARMRGTLVGALLASFYLFGLGFGPPLAALLSDALSPSGDKLGLALSIQSGVVLVPALMALALARGALRNRAVELSWQR